MNIRNPFRQRVNSKRTTGSSPGVVHASSDELVRYRLQARDLRLDCRQPARSVITGAHASRFRGRGMDYLESRSYQPGDDIRSMDWRVTARTGRAHVKLYQEERERPVVVMADLGPGMFFGHRGRHSGEKGFGPGKHFRRRMRRRMRNHFRHGHGPGFGWDDVPEDEGEGGEPPADV